MDKNTLFKGKFSCETEDTKVWVTPVSDDVDDPLYEYDVSEKGFSIYFNDKPVVSFYVIPPNYKWNLIITDDEGCDFEDIDPEYIYEDFDGNAYYSFESMYSKDLEEVIENLNFYFKSIIKNGSFKLKETDIDAFKASENWKKYLSYNIENRIKKEWKILN